MLMNEKCVSFPLSIDATVMKLIALIAMTVDHIGYFILPEMPELRIAGRLAYPIFAYMIVEGCEHTKNKLRYFLNVLGVGLVCSVASFLAEGSLYQSIMITFACAILLIFAVKYVEATSRLGGTLRADAAKLAAVLITVLVYCIASGKITPDLQVDYGFLGIATPVLAALGQSKLQRLLLFAVGLTLLAWSMGGVQIFSLSALCLLALYNGRRRCGVSFAKGFFYAYYPLHLVVIYGIAQMT